MRDALACAGGYILREVSTCEGLSPTAEFGALFNTVRRSAWRWECQGDYQVDRGQAKLWRAGQPWEDDDIRDWRQYLRRLSAAKIPFRRVRMLTEQ